MQIFLVEMKRNKSYVSETLDVILHKERTRNSNIFDFNRYSLRYSYELISKQRLKCHKCQNVISLNVR